MLNIDMIGRNEEKDDEPASENEDSIHLVGTKHLSDALHQEVLQANQHVGFRFEYDEERVYRRSDHYSFASKSIPSTFLFGGFNPYYHQTTDGLDGQLQQNRQCRATLLPSLWRRLRMGNIS